MDHMNQNDRIHWLDSAFRNGCCLTTEEMAEKLQISVRTLRRDIEDLKDHGAPVEFDRVQGVYRYTHPNYELQGSWLGEDELIGLVLAKRLAVTIPDGARKEEIQRLFDKIYQKTLPAMRLLDRRVSLKNICYYRVRPEVFDTVLHALYRDRKLHFVYRPVFAGGETERTVCPLHLILYRGNWHLAAFCELRQENRLFALSRMHRPQLLSDAPCPSHRLDDDFHERLETVHGIFLSDHPITVRLRFSPAMAGFAREQVWFPGQAIEEDGKGRLVISFPVGDFPEIVQEILGYGPEVEVLEPAELRETVAGRIAAMARLYR